MSVQLPTIQEKSGMSLYTDHGFLSEEKRIKACYNTLDKQEQAIIRTDCIKKVALHAVEGSLVGGIAGGFGGGMMGYVLFNIPGIVPWAIQGTKIGIGLGGLGGACYGIYDFRAEYICSDKYKKWVENARQTEVYPIYEKIIQDDRRFDGFLCMLTKELISVPMKGPDAQVYEQSVIVEWINHKEMQIAQAREEIKALENKLEKKEEKLEDRLEEEKRKIGIKNEIEWIEDKIVQIRKSISYIHTDGFGIEDLVYYPEYFTKLDSLTKLKISEMEEGEAKKLFEQAMLKLMETHEENEEAAFNAQCGAIFNYVEKYHLDISIAQKARKQLIEDKENRKKVAAVWSNSSGDIKKNEVNSNIFVVNCLAFLSMWRGISEVCTII